MLTSVSLRYLKAVCNESEYTLIKKYTKLQLKNEIQEMSLWFKMSFYNEKWRDINLILMYVITLGESSEFEEFLEKFV